MNYGSIAYVNENRLFIPEYLLRPFNIDNSTNLTILSYTKPDHENEENLLKKSEYKNIPEQHDIFITPIPFRLWPFLVRARIYLRDTQGSVASVTRYLAMEKMNILSADCHRAGFRYMVYNCVLECSGIRQKYNIIAKNVSQHKTPFINDVSTDDEPLSWISLNEEIKEKVNKIRRNLELPKIDEESQKKINDRERLNSRPYKTIDVNAENYEDDVIFEMRRFLFLTTKNEDENGIFSEIHKSSTLPFHFHEISSSASEKDRIAHYSKYTDGSIKLPKSYLAELKKNHDIDLTTRRCSPTFGLVNVDTTAPRIRVTITPKFQINNFRRIIIDYRRDSKTPGSSVGFLAVVADRLTSKHNLDIQNVVNRIWVNKRRMELGKVELIAEKKAKKTIIWNEVEKDIKKIILDSKNNFHHSKTIVKCTPINPYKFFVSLKTTDKKFVKNTKKLLYKAGEKFGIAKEDFRFIWTHSSPVTEAVIEALKECNALIQIYHSTDLEKDDFNWLNGEFLAMRALSKPCVRVCSGRKYFENDFSQFDKDVMPSIINFAHGDKKITKKYRELLYELINRIEINEPNALNRFL
jgi:hypothetical protein